MATTRIAMGSPDPNVKEIHNTHNIKSRTDLNSTQIEAVNKMHTLGLIFGNGLVKTHLTDFMTLQLSKDRKSRGELVEAIKSRITDLVNKAKSGLIG